MKKIFVFGVLTFLVLSTVVSALITELNIQANEEEDYIIRVSDYQTSETIERVVLRSDEEGEISKSFQTEPIVLGIKLMSVDSSGKVLETKEFGPYPAGDAITIDFNSGLTVEEAEAEEAQQANQTTTNVTEEEANESILETQEEVTEPVTTSAVTGRTVGNFTDVFAKTKYYLYGVVLIAILVVFAFVAKTKMKPKIIQNDRPPTILSGNEALNDAERKIRAAQAELRRLRDESRLIEDQKQLEKDKQEWNAFSG